jgi:hypothetical protein
VTVVDPDAAAASEFGSAVMGAISHGGPRLMGWVVATEDLDATARRLSLEVSRGSRTRPDGSVLRWRLAGVARAMAAGALPFFVQWDVPAHLHPGAAVAAHAVRPEGIAWIAVGCDPEELRTWLGGADLPVRVTEGHTGLSAVAIATAGGELLLH